MKISTTLVLLLTACGIVNAGITTNKPPALVPGFSLKLAEESYFTDVHGVFCPAQMVVTPIGNLVRIYRPDGNYYAGMVTEIEETETAYKIYGVVNNVKDTNFGFALAKGGVFAGAVVEKSEAKIYTVEFSESHKGYVLMRSAKHENL